MKKVIVLTAALTLAAPAIATAQSQVQPLNTTTSTAGPALGLAGAGGLAFGIIAIGVLAAASSNGT